MGKLNKLFDDPEKFWSFLGAIVYIGLVIGAVFGSVPMAILVAGLTISREISDTRKSIGRYMSWQEIKKASNE
jgi:hypothetical protein